MKYKKRLKERVLFIYVFGYLVTGTINYFKWFAQGN